MSSESRKSKSPDRMAALERSATLLRRIQRLAKVGGWLWDITTDTIQWSEGAFEIYGLAPVESASFELFYSLVHPDDLEAVRATVEKVRTTGQNETSEFRIIRKSDGAIRHLRVESEPLEPTKGTTAGFVGVIIDVTADVAAREALRESEARWKSLALNPYDFVVIVDRDGVFHWVNHTAPGIDEADLIGKATMFDFVDADYHAAVRGALRRAIDDRAPAYYEAYSSRLGAWFASAVGPLVREGKPVLASVQTRNITESRRAEVELRRRGRLLADAQRIAGFGSWHWDRETNVLEWSDEMYRICGLDLGTEPTLSLYHSLVHPDDRHRVVANDAAVLHGERVEPQEYRIIRVSDQSERHVLTAGEAIRDARGTVTGFLGTTLDVTERRELEADLAQSRKLEAVGRLAGGIAHDFNNVLTAILGNAELAATEFEPDHPAMTYVEAIQSAARRASGLTRQLLAFARRQIVSPRAVSPNQLIETMSGLFRPLLGADVRLSTDLAPDAWPVFMDVGQLEQLLMNLAVNARDAMPGGGTLAIQTQNTTVLDSPRPHPELLAGDYVRIVVSDTGCGIAPELQPQVFEPFFTTKPVGQGTGLGLATCYGIVKQNKGHIWLESELERGTRVFIYLPRAQEPSASVPPPRPRETLRGGECVLLVEDDPEVRGLCAKQLRELGYRVLEAGTGAAALEIARRESTQLDLLLTDVVLPDLRGPEVALLVAEVRPGAKVLYTSGYTDETFMSGREEGPVHFLQKPYTAEGLATAVRDALETGLPIGVAASSTTKAMRRVDRAV